MSFKALTRYAERPTKDNLQNLVINTREGKGSIGAINSVNWQFFREGLSEGEVESSVPAEQPTEYQGVKLYLVEDEEPDYLKMDT